MTGRLLAAALALLLAAPARADDRVQGLIRRLKAKDAHERWLAALEFTKMEPPPAEAMAPLGEAVNDADFHVRMTAVGGLYLIGAGAQPTLLKAADGKNVDDRTYEEVIRAVSKLKPEDPAALDLLGKATLSGRAHAASTAGVAYEVALKRGSVEAMRALCLFLIGPNMEARAEAATTLSNSAKSAPPLLAKVLETETDGTSSVWRGAIEAYARLDDGPVHDAVPDLVRLLKTGQPFTRANAARAMAGLHVIPEDALKALSDALLHDADGLVAAEAGDALAAQTPAGLPYLVKALDADDALVRVKAARSLSKVDATSEKAAFSALKDTLADNGECQAVRSAAGEALMLLDKAKARDALAALKTDRRKKAGKSRASCP